MKLWILALMVIGCAGCVISGVVPTGGPRALPRPLGEVKVMFAEPAQPYDQLAIVTVQGGSAASESMMYRKLQSAGAKLGADAVIVGGKDTSYWTGRSLSGSAIKFR